MPKAIVIKPWDKYWRLTLTWLDKYIRSWKRNDTIRYVECICDCWTTKRIQFSHIRSWSIKSCWCQKIESSLKSSNKNKTHWQTWTRFYIIYKSIKRRCCCPSVKSYKHYWWRWIRCERNSFEEFYSDMKEQYDNHVALYWENNTTIERIDVNWNYNKNNCRRATKIEQANNKTTNHIVTYNWKQYTVSDLCKEKWVPYLRTLRRINKWRSIEDSIRFPEVPSHLRWRNMDEKIKEYFRSKWY